MILFNTWDLKTLDLQGTLGYLIWIPFPFYFLLICRNFVAAPSLLFSYSFPYLSSTSSRVLYRKWCTITIWLEMSVSECMRKQAWSFIVKGVFCPWKMRKHYIYSNGVSWWIFQGISQGIGKTIFVFYNDFFGVSKERTGVRMCVQEWRWYYWAKGDYL